MPACKSAVVQSALKASEQFWLAEPPLAESLISSPSGGVAIQATGAHQPMRAFINDDPQTTYK